MGIDVQVVCPFFVCTKLLPLEASLTVPDSVGFVRSALKTIRTQPITNGCFIHNIMVRGHTNMINYYQSK